MVIISDNIDTTYRYTNNERWARYIDTSQLDTLSTNRLSPLQLIYYIVVMHHDELTCNLEFRIVQLGLML